MSRIARSNLIVKVDILMKLMILKKLTFDMLTGSISKSPMVKRKRLMKCLLKIWILSKNGHYPLEGEGRE